MCLDLRNGVEAFEILSPFPLPSLPAVFQGKIYWRDPSCSADSWIITILHLLLGKPSILNAKVFSVWCFLQPANHFYDNLRLCLSTSSSKCRHGMQYPHVLLSRSSLTGEINSPRSQDSQSYKSQGHYRPFCCNVTLGWIAELLANCDF